MLRHAARSGAPGRSNRGTTIRPPGAACCNARSGAECSSPVSPTCRPGRWTRVMSAPSTHAVQLQLAGARRHRGRGPCQDGWPPTRYWSYSRRRLAKRGCHVRTFRWLAAPTTQRSRDGAIYSTFWDANGGWFNHWFRLANSNFGDGFTVEPGSGLRRR